jgi:hypothetical protein
VLPRRHRALAVPLDHASTRGTSCRWYRPAIEPLPPEPGRRVVCALLGRTRRARGCSSPGDDRLETRAYAVKRYLFRLGHAGRSARYGTQGAAVARRTAALLTIRGREWLSARELRRDPSWRLIAESSVDRAHRPNLGVLVRSSRVAIEVELWRRPTSKVRSMLRGYGVSIASRQIDGLIAVSDRADVLDAMSQAAARVGRPDRCFAMRRLADVLG